MLGPWLPTLLATHFVDDHMEKALSWVQTSMYSIVQQLRELLKEIFRYATSMVLLCAGFAIHRTEESGFG
jgi:hypothetical protein